MVVEAGEDGKAEEKSYLTPLIWFVRSEIIRRLNIVVSVIV